MNTLTLLAIPFLTSAADRMSLPDGGLRGLALHNGVFYVGHYQNGTVAAYDASGRKLRVYQVEPRKPFLGHGVATNGVSLWTSDYSGKTIYEFDVKSAKLERSFTWTGPGQPTRMECDGQDLLITTYRDPTVYRVGRDGKILHTFRTDSTDENLQIALVDDRKLLVSDSPRGRLLIYDTHGKKLGEVPSSGGRWAIATDVSNRNGPLYGDTESGGPAVVKLSQQAIPKYLTETNRIQDWMIWGGAPGSRSSYEPTGTGVRILDGPRTFNRPLYGDHTASVVLAGDRPQIMLAEAPGLCWGVLSIAIDGNKPAFLHALNGVEMAYDGATARHEIADPALQDASLSVETVAFREGLGFISRLTSNKPIKLLWTYGGLAKGMQIQGQDGLPGGIDVGRHKGDHIQINGSSATIRDTDAVDGTVHVQAPLASELTASQADAPFAEAKQGDRPLLLQRIQLEPDTPLYVIVCAKRGEEAPPAIADPQKEFLANRNHFEQVANRLAVKTPDPALDSAVRLNNLSQDALWWPDSFLHGVIRWGHHCNCWFLGWRGWYGASVMGWHDRVKKAAHLHANHQLKPNDWLNGYVISVLPFDQKHDGKFHYNMQEVFLDHVYYDYHHTGDPDFAKDMLPTVKAALGFQKNALDADGNHLYLNRLNTWISDGHVYNGDCSQSSAYTYRANRMAAEFARAAGQDPAPFDQEADAIKKAMFDKLWIADRGYFCEYVDADGIRHDAAEAPSQYHPIDFFITDEFQTYQALRYIENRFWRFGDQILVNDWYPVVITNGTLANAELLNTALCYYRIGERDKPYRLLRSAMKSFYSASVPGSISCYTRTDASQGTYVDFADAVSMFARTVAEGTFGVLPRMQDKVVTIRPGFPEQWDRAGYRSPDFEYTFRRDGDAETWHLRTQQAVKWILQIGYKNRHVVSASSTGKPVEIRRHPGLGHEWAELTVGPAQAINLTLSTKTVRFNLDPPSRIARGDTLSLRSVGIAKVHDPQSILTDVNIDQTTGLTAKVTAEPGPHTFFLLINADGRRHWQPIDLHVCEPLEIKDARLCVPWEKDRPVTLKAVLVNNAARSLNGPIALRYAGIERQLASATPLAPNAERVIDEEVDDATRLSPGRLDVQVRLDDRPATATTTFWRLLSARPDVLEGVKERLAPLPLPMNRAFESIFGDQPHLTDDEEHQPRIHFWSWYKKSYMNLDRLREKLDDKSIYHSAIGVPFRIARSGNNGLFVSRWDGWPTKATVPVNSPAEKLYLLMANVTMNNNTYLTNATITVNYADGMRREVPLRNPDTFDNTCQHFSDNFPITIGGAERGYYGHGRASASHADVFDIQTDPNKLIRSLDVEVQTRRTMVGILAVTALKPR
ncbi:MAG: hypothetical protein JXQ73_26305 [Phycisphaerae bacterium]|nr:hypothetical protein [Phycisphaerae bacterium]